MMSVINRKLSLVTLIALIVAVVSMSACGTAATPEPIFTATPTATAEPIEPVAQAATAEGDAPTTAPTATPEPPTATPEPPTATPEPTEEPTAETQPQAAAPVGNDTVSVMVSLANPANGETLFNTSYDTNVGPFACFTCHNVDSEEKKIGPGQLHIGERAATRIEGLSAAQYIYNSITDPNAYLVEGFVENLMPSNYSELLTEQEIYDIVAYMFTLQ